MEGIAWRWQSIDGAMMQAPLAQEEVGIFELLSGARSPLILTSLVDCGLIKNQDCAKN